MSRDVLDRYYTPPALARACVATLAVSPPNIVVEPSVGGGAFARAVRARWPDAHIHGVDVDPAAPGLSACDSWATATWDEGARGMHGAEVDLIVGNPPYREAEAHVRLALETARPYGTVAFLLRLGFLAGQARRALWDEYPPSGIHVLSRRPSFTGGGTDASEYAFFVWTTPCVALDVRHVPIVRWLDWGAP